MTTALGILLLLAFIVVMGVLAGIALHWARDDMDRLHDATEDLTLWLRSDLLRLVAAFRRRFGRG